ncbi:unnamed protein product [Ostreobium quekettii]|uniref:HP domain-containing protein n=1 Tax=Ostreobium quekettii TaxID=121088 RepID=A0A8S1IXM8_9CHLO|nr:unnamed protein product [Ostreobium quekettii]|eukprot:evm.model.scf_1181.2 EVM.evm.TU.scf_1181.2   scf_1181:27242-41379(+)
MVSLGGFRMAEDEGASQPLLVDCETGEAVLGIGAAGAGRERRIGGSSRQGTSSPDGMGVRWSWEVVCKLFGLVVLCWLLVFSLSELVSRMGQSPQSHSTNLGVPTLVSLFVLLLALWYLRRGPAVPDAVGPTERSLFTGAGRSLGIEVWRIQDFVPVLVPQADVGKFAKGDAYIVLHTYLRFNEKAYKLHFWIGSQSSQDEAGSAAILSSQLQKELGSTFTLYRELEGEESSAFLELFPRGLRYSTSTNHRSGFVPVQPEPEAPKAKMFQINGGTTVHVAEVPLCLNSLNNSDCFLLDDGQRLYQWSGQHATRAAKSKAFDMTLSIKDDRRQKIQVIVLDPGDMESEDAKEFFGKLGCEDMAAVRIPDTIMDEQISARFSPPVLYEAGDGMFVEVARDRLRHDMLRHDAVFIVQSGESVFLWVGRNVTKLKRSQAATVTASKFLDWRSMDKQQIVKVVRDQFEPPIFKEIFHKWPKEVVVPVLSDLCSSRSGSLSTELSTPVRGEMDMAAIVSGGIDDREGIDELSGTATVWWCRQFRLKPWPVERYGEFYSGHSYVVQYTFKSGSRHTVYFWLGRDSSVTDQGVAATNAAKMAEGISEVTGEASASKENKESWTTVRVPQHKEPGHFCRIFKSSVIVHSGKFSEDEKEITGPELYRVRSTTRHNLHAVQVRVSAQCLDSRNSFVVVDGEGATLWHGKASSGRERDTAQNVAMRLASTTRREITEGEEDEAFWSLIGGQRSHATGSLLPPKGCNVRLFQIDEVRTSGSGSHVEEIFNFVQEDLCDDDVMMLDACTKVFLWVGRNAKAGRKPAASEVAAKYIKVKSKIQGSDAGTPVEFVDAGHEPPDFTCHFWTWDRAEEPLQHVGGMEAAEEKASTSAVHGGDQGQPHLKKVVSYVSLQTMGPSDGVDPNAKEDHLSDEQFVDLFKQTREEFRALPPWRRKMLKKQVGLF